MKVELSLRKRLILPIWRESINIFVTEDKKKSIWNSKNLRYSIDFSFFVKNVLFKQAFLHFTQVKSFHSLLKHVPANFALIFIIFAFVVLAFNILFSNISTFFHAFGYLRLLRLRCLLLLLIIVVVGSRSICSACCCLIWCCCLLKRFGFQLHGGYWSCWSSSKSLLDYFALLGRLGLDL